MLVHPYELKEDKSFSDEDRLLLEVLRIAQLNQISSQNEDLVINDANVDDLEELKSITVENLIKTLNAKK